MSVDFVIRRILFSSDDVTINDDADLVGDDFCECRSGDCK